MNCWQLNRNIKKPFKLKKNNIDFTNKYAKNDSRFGTNINTWNDYLEEIDANIDREAMLLLENGYSNTPLETRKDVARTIMLKMAKDDYLDRRLYMEYGGKNLTGADDGRYAQNLPEELKIQENFKCCC